MNTGLLELHALTSHKGESAKTPTSTALDFARSTGTNRNNRETNRGQCKTVLGLISAPTGTDSGVGR